MIGGIQLKPGDRIILQDKRIGQIKGWGHDPFGYRYWTVALEGVLDNYMIAVMPSEIYGMIVGVADDSATFQTVRKGRTKC